MLWERLDNLLNIIVRAICLFAFFICMYAVYDGYMIYHQASDQSVLIYKPSEKEPDKNKIEGSVAWLTIDGTAIDYPVMQGIDNAEYINKDAYGNYSVSGSIFLDCRNAADFSDPYSLIYGHHMEYDFMFGSLDKFLDKEFFETHKTGTLTANGKVHHIDLFAVVEAPAEDEKIFAPNEAEYPLSYIKEHATIKTDSFPKNGKILGMSTCKYPETSDRTILFGILK